MSRPTRDSRHRSLFRVHRTELLEPRLLLAVGPAALVKDINTVSASSDPFSFVAFKGETFFRANDGAHGIEWFRTDGTPGGTSMLVDLNPGTGGSFPGGFIGDARENPSAAVVGDVLVFSGFAPGGAGSELYKTDGTAAGTVLLRDIRPGGGSSVPQQFLAAGNTLYFTADDGASGRQIWKTDGTAGGTVRVTNIPNDNAALTPKPLGMLGSRLVFSGRHDDGATPGRELWVTDGTPAGTALLKNIHPSGSSSPGFTANGIPEVVVIGNRMYFAATDAVHGRELWQTDGTAEGTFMAAELVPGPGSSSPTNLTAVNSHLYFTATQPPGVGGSSSVYWRDPTGAITDITPRTEWNASVGFPGSAGNVGGVFYLGAWFLNSAALFKHDPRTATPGTDLTLVKGLAQATNWDFSAGPILDVGGKAVLLAQGPTGSNTIHLWQSDGTAQGTVDLATFLEPGIPDNSEFARWNLARGAGGLLYFAGATPLGGTEPFRTDGTAAGTFGLGDVNGNTLGSNPGPVVYLGGGRSVFTAEEPEHGRELWVTDGTAAGTSLVKDIEPGPRGSFRAVPFLLGPALNGRTYFAAVSFSTGTEDIGSELWTSDGTPQGTYRLKPELNLFPRNFAALNGRMYFTARGTTGGLWETDGTEAGTRPVSADLSGTPSPLVRNGDLLYFTTFRSDAGGELWKTDGTADGTRPVSPLGSSPIAAPSTPVVMGGDLYFTAPTDDGAHALWRSDGTAGGTGVVAELPGRYPKLVPLDDVLLLSRGEPGQEVESDVWVSDGTAAGTVPLASRVPALADFEGSTNSLGDPQLTAFGGDAYFFGVAGGGPAGVWRTDGTAPGTRLVRTFGGQPRLTPAGVADGRLYFSAGTQLWRTDGTEAGTELVHDGTAGGVTGGVVDAGRFVFFTGADAAHGTELWAMHNDEPEVYVRGSAWAESFKTYLGHNGLGDYGYGYRVDGNGNGAGAGGGATDILPWVNMNQVVVRFAGDMSNRGIPTPNAMSIQSQRGVAYAVTRVEPVPGDANAFVFVLDRPLGGDVADASRNGDRLTVTVADAGEDGADVVRRITVLQGDVNGDGRVLAEDYAQVKKKFFRGTAGPYDPADPSANYSPLHDVDGSGVILAIDYAEVKKRFFQTLPDDSPTAAAAANATVAHRRSRPVTREWFASTPLIA